jgi:hypothetical protein
MLENFFFKNEFYKKKETRGKNLKDINIKVHVEVETFSTSIQVSKFASHKFYDNFHPQKKSY